MRGWLSTILMGLLSVCCGFLAGWWSLDCEPPAKLRWTHPPGLIHNGTPVIVKQPAGLEAATRPVSQIEFEEMAASSGVRFTYYGNPSGSHPMTEQNGGGVALLDYDRDGVLDLFFTNGSHFQQPAHLPEHSQRIYRSAGTWKYRDETLPARIGAIGYGMGCAVGDWDNDGFPDLYVTAYGSNTLWHNNGDGTFNDVTPATGTAVADRWSTSAAWGDLDGDGDLDLYVANYVDWSPADPPCYTKHQPHPVQISCGPLGRNGQPDVVFENRGDGRFVDRSVEAGINLPSGKGLDVVLADLDGNGRLDVYVANDTTDNFLFLNHGSWKFAEVGVAQGAAVSEAGTAQSSMGIALGDLNADGAFDLGVSNFENEVNDLYLNLGQGEFRAANRELGLNPLSRSRLGFGMVCVDADADHYPELFVLNGHIWDLRELGLNHAYEMPAQLLKNQGGLRFRDDSVQYGRYFQKRWLGRSIAQGDLDNDDDTDLAVTHLLQPAELLRNASVTAGKTVRVEFIGHKQAREARGCRVEYRLGARTYVSWVPGGGGFQASSDLRVILPVDNATHIAELSITWPDGTLEIWRDVPVQSPLTLHEGSGTQ